jgi:hypothetical protein
MNREVKSDLRPTDRLQRMRRMFAVEGGILAEDYRYFTRQDEPTPRSKVKRKSVARSAPPALKRS